MSLLLRRAGPCCLWSSAECQVRFVASAATWHPLHVPIHSSQPQPSSLQLHTAGHAICFALPSNLLDSMLSCPRNRIATLHMRASCKLFHRPTTWKPRVQLNVKMTA